MDTTSDAINIEIADLFSSVIAPQFRDMDFAKACLKRALMFHPESANALHKLGVFYTQQVNYQDIQLTTTVNFTTLYNFTFFRVFSIRQKSG